MDPRRRLGTHPLLGIVDAGGYGSAPPRANGQSVSVEQVFLSDLVVALSIPNASAGVSRALQVRCTNPDSNRVVVLADGETRYISGEASGSRCRVSDPQGNARYEDNTGDPYDGLVTIVWTPQSCWDLRIDRPECGARVRVIASPADPALNPTETGPTTTSPTTTSPTTTAAPIGETQQRTVFPA